MLPDVILHVDTRLQLDGMMDGLSLRSLLNSHGGGIKLWGRKIALVQRWVLGFGVLALGSENGWDKKRDQN